MQTHVQAFPQASMHESHLLVPAGLGLMGMGLILIGCAILHCPVSAPSRKVVPCTAAAMHRPSATRSVQACSSTAVSAEDTEDQAVGSMRRATRLRKARPLRWHKLGGTDESLPPVEEEVGAGNDEPAEKDPHETLDQTGEHAGALALGIGNEAHDSAGGTSRYVGIELVPVSDCDTREGIAEEPQAGASTWL